MHTEILIIEVHMVVEFHTHEGKTNEFRSNDVELVK